MVLDMIVADDTSVYNGALGKSEKFEERYRNDASRLEGFEAQE